MGLAGSIVNGTHRLWRALSMRSARFGLAPRGCPAACEIRLAIVFTVVGILQGAALAQFRDASSHPVYVADSPSADVAVSRATELSRAGNTEEAAVVLDGLLRADAGALTAWPEGGEGVFRTVRAKIHDVLLEDGVLLEAYRGLVEERARAMLDAGEADEVERSYLLADAGFDATMRRAQRAMESARFASAYLLLEQLDRHPGRVGGRAVSAANLLASVSRFAGRGEEGAVGRRAGDTALVERIGALLASWRADAGLAQAAAPAGVTPPAPVLVADPYEPVGPGRLDGVARRPLAAVPIRSSAQATAIAEARRATARNRGRDTGEVYPPMPVVAGELVIVNSGREIMAWDRYTLAPEWSLEVVSWGGATGRAVASDVDDINTVLVDDGVIIAVTEVASRLPLTDERVIVAIDAETGVPLWRRTLWEFEEAGLESAVVSGRPTIEDGVLVLAALKRVPAERLFSVWMIGLDVRTGDRLWVRPIVSAGREQWNDDREIADGGAGTAGLVVRGDELGVIVAIEALTGRVRWLRSESAAERFSRTLSGVTPWSSNVPQVSGDGVYMMSPSRDWLLQLNRWDGAEVVRRPASQLGRPMYLVLAGDTLMGVGQAGVTAQPVSSFAASAGVESLYSFLGDDREPAGRAAAVGDDLLVPIESGVVRLRPNMEEGRARRLALPAAGNVVALDGYLAVATNDHLRAFSSWEIANERLSARMDADPNNPRVALTYAKLAYQAGRPEAIIDAVDRGLAAIERDPLDEGLRVARAEMFETLLSFVEPWRDPAANERAGAGQGALAGEPVLRGDLIGRLGALASSPEERASYLFALGDHLESTGDAAGAVRRYQEIVLDQRLARTVYMIDAGRSSSADIEATRRLRRVVEAMGDGVYTPFDRDAATEFAAALEAGGDPEAMLAVARRYPLAGSSGVAWTAAGLAYRDQGRSARAVYALEEAIRLSSDVAAVPFVNPLPAADARTVPGVLAKGGAAETTTSPSGDEGSESDTTPTHLDDSFGRTESEAVHPAIDAAPAPPTLAERAHAVWSEGRPALRAVLIGVLADSGRVREAAIEVSLFESDHGFGGPWRVEIGGRSLTVAEAAAELALLPPSGGALPRIGPVLGEVVTLPGWVVQRLPFGVLPGAPLDVAVAVSGAESVGLLRSEGGEIALAWEVRSSALPQAIGPTTIYLLDRVGIGAQTSFAVEARSIDDGSVVWRSASLGEAFGGPPAAGLTRSVHLPLRSGARLGEVEVLIGDSVITLMDRSGRTLGIDRQTGATRWRTEATVDVVHAAAQGRGVVVIAGGDLAPGQSLDTRHAPEDREHRLVAIEAATGVVLQRIVPGSAVGWLTLTASGDAVVGTVRGVESFDPQRGTRRWSREAEMLVSSRAGVALPGAVVVRGREQRLWVLDDTTGRLATAPIQDGDILSRGFREVWLQPLTSGMAIATGHGVAVFDGELGLIGLDDRRRDGRLEPAVFGAGFYAALQRTTPWGEQRARETYTLRVHSLPGCRVEAIRTLESVTDLEHVTAINGWVLLSGSRHTFAVPSSAGDAGGR